MQSTKIVAMGWQQTALELTQTGMERWYTPDATAFLPYLDDNIVWIGAAAGQYYFGRAAVEQALRQAAADLQPCAVSAQNYTATALSSILCLVTGRIVVTLRGKEMYLTEPQRITAVWRKVKNARGGVRFTPCPSARIQ